MTSEQSLLPSVYLWNPLVEREQSWYPTERHDIQEEDDQPPRGDTQRGVIESVKIQPCTDVDEADTVKHKIDHRKERFCVGLPVDTVVPGYRCTYKVN